ncbi:Hsp20/alpha crystallin family protein [Singulisphaera sp. Ch08]|uniref:Hsp20/alpha crystallin family protein n=1 Tax=Singulisphaera sp. Ch08 TaxID=3120278 RepID=A0AAU7CIE3_9BACT
MAIQAYEPLREMVSLRDAMNSLFQESFVRPLGLPAEGGSVMLPLDVTEDENEFIIKMSMPGAQPEDVHVTAHGHDLTIRGEIKAEQERKESHWHLRERRFGQFQRTVTLPTMISPDKAQASFENGVLMLVLPKAEEAKPKEIKIGRQAQSQIGSQKQTHNGGQKHSQSRSRTGGQEQAQAEEASQSPSDPTSQASPDAR